MSLDVGHQTQAQNDLGRVAHTFRGLETLALEVGTSLPDPAPFALLKRLKCLKLNRVRTRDTEADAASDQEPLHIRLLRFALAAAALSQVPRLEVLWCPPLPRSAPPDGGAAAAAAMETLSLTDGKLPQLKVLHIPAELLPSLDLLPSLAPGLQELAVTDLHHCGLWVDDVLAVAGRMGLQSVTTDASCDKSDPSPALIAAAARVSRDQPTVLCFRALHSLCAPCLMWQQIAVMASMPGGLASLRRLDASNLKRGSIEEVTQLLALCPLLEQLAVRVDAAAHSEGSRVGAGAGNPPANNSGASAAAAAAAQGTPVLDLSHGRLRKLELTVKARPCELQLSGRLPRLESMKLTVRRRSHRWQASQQQQQQQRSPGLLHLAALLSCSPALRHLHVDVGSEAGPWRRVRDLVLSPSDAGGQEGAAPSFLRGLLLEVDDNGSQPGWGHDGLRSDRLEWAALRQLVAAGVMLSCTGGREAGRSWSHFLARPAWVRALDPFTSQLEHLYLVGNSSSGSVATAAADSGEEAVVLRGTGRSLLPAGAAQQGSGSGSSSEGSAGEEEEAGLKEDGRCHALVRNPGLLAAHFPRLTSLLLFHADCVTEARLSGVLSALPSLLHLDMINNHNPDMSKLKVCHARLQSVRLVHFHHLAAWELDCPALTRLELDNSDGSSTPTERQWRRDSLGRQSYGPYLERFLDALLGGPGHESVRLPVLEELSLWHNHDAMGAPEVTEPAQRVDVGCAAGHATLRVLELWNLCYLRSLRLRRLPRLRRLSVSDQHDGALMEDLALEPELLARAALRKSLRVHSRDLAAHVLDG